MNLFKRDRYKFLNMYQGYVGNLSRVFSESYWLNHPDPEIVQLYISLTTSPYALSDNWADMHQITTPEERANLTQSVIHALLQLKLKTVMKYIKESGKKIKEEYDAGNDPSQLIEHHQKLERVKIEICKELGIAIIK